MASPVSIWIGRISELSPMSDIPSLTPEINYGKAIMSGAFSIAVPTIQETLEKLEIMGRMHALFDFRQILHGSRRP